MALISFWFFFRIQRGGRSFKGVGPSANLYKQGWMGRGSKKLQLNGNVMIE